MGIFARDGDCDGDLDRAGDELFVILCANCDMFALGVGAVIVALE